MSDQPPTPPGPELPAPPPLPPPLPPAPSPSPQQTPYAAPYPRSEYHPPPSKTMAGWALGLAIVPCFGISALVGIGLAIAVLVRSSDGRDYGKGRAIAALIIGPLWLVVGVVVGVAGAIDDISGDADRDSSGHVTGRDDMSVLKVRVGDCIDYPALAETEGMTTSTDMTVTAIPCDEPHQFEAYHGFPVDADEFPGDERIRELAVRGCFKAFHDFVGIPYGRSALEPYVLYPTAGTWRLMDDRSITCLVGLPGERTTGTLEGSRR